MVKEAQRDRGSTPAGGPVTRRLGASMVFDHRRILATAMGRLRGKMKYRPVVFELMPPEFTLLELAAHGGSAFRHSAAQAEFPQARRSPGPGRGHRTDVAQEPRPAGRAIPLPQGSPARTARPRRARWRQPRIVAPSLDVMLMSSILTVPGLEPAFFDPIICSYGA